MAIYKRRYNAHRTIAQFHRSQAFHRAIRGPRGSGKSTGCCMELFRRAAEQAPSPDKIRHSRWIIVRNTYRELLDTTLKTWLQWFPEESIGQFNNLHMMHNIRWKDIDAQFLFRALDRPSDVKKTLSLELTGGWINEAKEVPFGIVSALDDAIGRYPSKDIENGFNGPSWAGLILDTNSPDDDHWWYRLETNLELDKSIWQFFVQPGGLIERSGKFIPNPDAENLENLPKNYYEIRAEGKSLDHVRVYYCNQFGYIQEGKPVHPDYADAIHCSHELLKPVVGLPIYIGMDFGLTPAAVLGQRLSNGRWIIFDEFATERLGVKQFGEDLKIILNQKYRDFEFECYGDPAGEQEAQTDQSTPFIILNNLGIQAQPAHANNDVTFRREALRGPLKRLIDGKPGFLISPNCKVLRKALKGGFCYKRKIISGGVDKYHDKPDKNFYSHTAEACEYLLLGAGEGIDLIKTPDNIKDELSDFHIEIDLGSNDHGKGWMR